MSAVIKLIVGVGNPGSQYETTRHNAGVWFIDSLLNLSNTQLKLEKKLQAYVTKADLWGHECLLMVPDTFMNVSGDALAKVMHYYKISIDQVLVAHDDLDLAPGVARWKLGGGHGGHNGLRDIFAKTKQRDFYRLRIGIGHPGNSHQVSSFVLHRPLAKEQTLLDDAILAARDSLPTLLEGDLQKAMTSLHSQR